MADFGARPTPFLTLDAYASRYRIHDIDEFERLRALISAMDLVYCAHKPK